jgi:hypothetical protein
LLGCGKGAREQEEPAGYGRYKSADVQRTPPSATGAACCTMKWLQIAGAIF